MKKGYRCPTPPNIPTCKCGCKYIPLDTHAIIWRCPRVKWWRVNWWRHSRWLPYGGWDIYGILQEGTQHE